MVRAASGGGPDGGRERDRRVAVVIGPPVISAKMGSIFWS